MSTAANLHAREPLLSQSAVAGADDAAQLDLSFVTAGPRVTPGR